MPQFPDRVRRGRAVTLLVGALIAGVALVSIVRSPFTQLRIPGISSAERDVREVSLSVEDLREVDIDGAWNVTIRDGSSPSITAEIPGGNAERFLDIDDGVLTLRGFNVGRALHATITTDRLEVIAIDGTGAITIGAMSVPTLEIVLDGAASVESSGLEVDRLTVELDGAGNIDLRDAEIVNADVSIEGAGQVRLSMAGGTLTGSIDGVGRIAYRGEVASRDVTVDGLGRVEQID